jgi:hypothetical protein
MNTTLNRSTIISVVVFAAVLITAFFLIPAAVRVGYASGVFVIAGMWFFLKSKMLPWKIVGLFVFGLALALLLIYSFSGVQPLPGTG